MTVWCQMSLFKLLDPNCALTWLPGGIRHFVLQFLKGHRLPAPGFRGKGLGKGAVLAWNSNVKWGGTCGKLLSLETSSMEAWSWNFFSQTHLPLGISDDFLTCKALKVQLKSTGGAYLWYVLGFFYCHLEVLNLAHLVNEWIMCWVAQYLSSCALWSFRN